MIDLIVLHAFFSGLKSWHIAAIFTLAAAAHIVNLFRDGQRSIDKTRKQVDEIVDWQREMVAENIRLREAISRVSALCRHPRNKTVRIAAVREALRPAPAILEAKK